MIDINIDMTNTNKSKKRGIYVVADYNKDMTKRIKMVEDARYSLTNSLDEADDENDDQNETPVQDTGVEGGLDLGGADMGQPKGTPDDMPAEDEDTLDLDALADNEGDQLPDEQSTPDMDMDISSEPTEEIDVTQFVEKGEQLTQKVDSQVQAMSQQISVLNQKLSTMDQLLGKIQSVEDEIRTMRPPKPIETLKLRSLDSYPYNQGIDDYWKQKEVEIEKLRDFNRVDNQEYVLTNDDVNNFSDIEIRDSLEPSNLQSDSAFPGPKTNQSTPSKFNRQPNS